MFRRLPFSLPKDPTVPVNLEKLGFFLNEDDQVRMIQKPEQKYQYKVNRNDRVNDVYKGALNNIGCVRAIVKERLLASSLDLEAVRLPLGAQAHERHVLIYVSRKIEQKKRVMVIFGERSQELGILSYRYIGESGIKVGSMQQLVDAVVNGPTYTSTDDIPGIIIANPGQLIWYRGGCRTIGDDEYLNLPRDSAVHAPFRIDPVHNRVPEQARYTNHVQYIIEHVMLGVANPEARFDIIGLEYTGDAAIRYLASHWGVWHNRINGICLGNPQFTLKELASAADHESRFEDFLAKRSRAYFVSDKPVETPIPGRDKHGCNCYASGEHLYEDGILVRSWRSMLDWFNMIGTLDDFEEPIFKLIDEADLEY